MSDTFEIDLDKWQSILDLVETHAVDGLMKGVAAHDLAAAVWAVRNAFRELDPHGRLLRGQERRR